MDEKKTTEEKKPETADTDPKEGSKSETTTLIDDANSAAERLEKANERKAELLRQEEEFEARRQLTGRTDTGQAPVEKEETPKEYKDRIVKGE